MLKLRTVYPYVLNDRLEDGYKKDGTYVFVGNRFPLPPKKHNCISSETSHKNNNSLPPDYNLNYNHLNYNLSNFSRVSLSLLNKYNFQNVLLQHNLNQVSNFIS